MNIILAQPTGELLDHRHIQSLEGLFSYCRATDQTLVYKRRVGSAMLGYSRSIIATEFLNENPPHSVLLWIDSDMTFDDPQPVVELCQEAYDRNCVVGAAASTKRRMGRMNVKFKDDQTFPVTFGNGGSVIEVLNVGTGMCAVPYTVFQELSKSLPLLNDEFGAHIYPFYKDTIIENYWWGEDMSFCHLARQHGIPICIDTRVRVGHRGFYEYQLEDTCDYVPYYRTLNVVVEPQK